MWGGTDSASAVHGEGTVVFETDIGGDARLVQLHKVLYVPAADANLLSLSVVAKAGGEFCGKGTALTVRLNGETMVQGLLSASNLYTFTATKSDHMDAIAHAATYTDRAPLPVWHARLAHLGFTNIRRMLSGNMVTGLSLAKAGTLPAADPDDIAPTCEACIMGKQHRDPFLTSPAKTTKPGQLLHADVTGPIATHAYGGYSYACVVMDDFSSYTRVALLKHKSGAAQFVIDTTNYIHRQSGCAVIAIRTDRGGEFVNRTMADFCAAQGIDHQLTAPHTSQSNGHAERAHRTLWDKTRAQLSHARLPKAFWGYSYLAANHARNLSPVSGKSKTPSELLHGCKPDVSHLRVFGCVAYAHVPQELRGKADPRSRRGIFVGYEHATGGGCYIVMFPDLTKAYTRDVKFFEDARGSLSAKASSPQEDYSDLPYPPSPQPSPGPVTNPSPVPPAEPPAATAPPPSPTSTPGAGGVQFVTLPGPSAPAVPPPRSPGPTCPFPSLHSCRPRWSPPPP